MAVASTAAAVDPPEENLGPDDLLEMLKAEAACGATWAANEIFYFNQEALLA